MKSDWETALRFFANIQKIFDLIVTSPPYADSRAKTYGGIKPSQYVDWFLARAQESYRVLKPTGTFMFTIE